MIILIFCPNIGVKYHDFPSWILCDDVIKSHLDQKQLHRGVTHTLNIALGYIYSLRRYFFLPKQPKKFRSNLQDGS